MDKSSPISPRSSFSSIAGKKLLLTGDAHGNDIVTAWAELGWGDAAQLDVLKMPHHGSIRNCCEAFSQIFRRQSLLFSANGKFDNPERRLSKR